MHFTPRGGARRGRRGGVVGLRGQFGRGGPPAGVAYGRAAGVGHRGHRVGRAGDPAAGAGGGVGATTSRRAESGCCWCHSKLWMARSSRRTRCGTRSLVASRCRTAIWPWCPSTGATHCHRVAGRRHRKLPEQTREVVPAAAGRAVWTVDGSLLPPRSKESASSLESLLGCPLRWGLNYRAKLRPGAIGELPDGNLLFGSLAHTLIEELPDRAPRLAARARGCEGDVRRTVRRRGGARGRNVAPAGSGRDAAEGASPDRPGRAGAGRCDPRWWLQGGRVRGGGFGCAVCGYGLCGLHRSVAESPASTARWWWISSGVVGRFARNNSRMATRCSSPLYANAVRKSGQAMPPTAFFVLSEARFLTLHHGLFDRAVVVVGPSMEATILRRRKPRMARCARSSGLASSLRRHCWTRDRSSRRRGKDSR